MTKSAAGRDRWTFPGLSTKMVAVTGDKPAWQALGRYVTRRRDELGMTQSDVQAAGGPSTATVRNIENATQTSYRSGVLAALERALRWAPGSVEAALAGGEPTPLDVAPSVTSDTDYEATVAWLRSIANNPNRGAALRSWAAAQLEQAARIREADLDEARTRGEVA